MPAGTQAAQHWAVRRWISEVTGVITITGTLSKIHSGSYGDGVKGYIYVDGEVVWSKYIRGDDAAGVNYSIDVFVNTGSLVDFAIAPTHNDWEDSSQFTAMVLGKNN